MELNHYQVPGPCNGPYPQVGGNPIYPPLGLWRLRPGEKVATGQEGSSAGTKGGVFDSAANSSSIKLGAWRCGSGTSPSSPVNFGFDLAGGQPPIAQTGQAGPSADVIGGSGDQR